MPATLAAADATALPLHLVTPASLEAWLAAQPEATAAWVRASGFGAEAGRILLLPGTGGLGGALAGVEEPLGPWSLAGLPAQLPGGSYRLAGEPPADKATALVTGWLLGGYRFDRFKRPVEKPAPETALVPPAGADAGLARKTAAAMTLTRDLVNTPAAEMGPAELAAAAEALAAGFGARFSVIVGDDLLSAGYPAVHAVGRAALRAPRLIDLTWGAADAPKVTLVGKGVCFDSGGLDIKPASGMRNMKKDMGGAATVLGLARLVMDTGLPVRLRVLVPAVENAISGDAFRPGDILSTRKGLTVEVGNTDAEGRLVLADALAEADAEKPDLLVDCATLTGAARVALGPDLPALFSPDDGLAGELLGHAAAVEDPLWRLPLWPGYAKWLESPVADLANVSENGHAGAVTAGLFLSRFVTDTPAWAHIDLYAWNDQDRPGRPKGGEAMALRALHALLSRRYGG